ncbi:hypothetical protein MBANPS3_008786 [Mucor bainieri]
MMKIRAGALFGNKLSGDWSKVEYTFFFIYPLLKQVFIQILVTKKYVSIAVLDEEMYLTFFERRHSTVIRRERRKDHSSPGDNTCPERFSRALGTPFYHLC